MPCIKFNQFKIQRHNSLCTACMDFGETL